uniref:Uncharacterized protein n=1 Tax=viral metagenome TaxID=1070528 RepID=A0A6C0J6E3_9ZZZZ
MPLTIGDIKTVKLDVNINTVNTENTIFLPGKDFTYGNTTDIENDDNTQFLVVSAKPPSKVIENDQNVELFLKYKKTINEDGLVKNEINWVKDLESLGTFPNKISQTISRSLPVGDFFTDVQTNVDNYNTSTNNYDNDNNIGADTKYKWINLSGTVIDIGLQQLTWNMNKQYYSIDDSQSIKNKKLMFKCENPIDEKLGFRINYLQTENKTEQSTTRNENDYIFEDHIGDLNLNCYKVNSIEILPGKNNRTTNVGNIEFYFELKSNVIPSNIFNNGITELTLNIPNTNQENNGENCFTYNCFTYNCEYLNCQHYNMFYNKNKSLTKKLQTITSTSGSFDLSNVIKNYIIPPGDYELEGGKGRKSMINITNTNNDNSEINFTIKNSGYLYQEGDFLRIKDNKLRNLMFFSVSDISNDNENSTISNLKFTQEFVKAHHGKSNTLKYALGTKESLLIKELNISGSTQSKILVRLIEICKPWKYPNTNTSGTNIDDVKEKYSQRVIREFYYFNRTNINDVHHINKLIHPESEIYVDIQKLLEVDDDDSKVMDTLTFTLNGIKINLNGEGTLDNNFIMQRDI